MKGKNILLCVSGGIAVYKSAALTSKLVQAGANVKVIMSESATKFVTTLTFQSLSRQDVYVDTFNEIDATKIAHIDLANWADLCLVAPATANAIGKLANGIADSMLTTTLLATPKPVWIAPAMNVHMYENEAVKRNIKQLHADGFRFIEPSEGYLACGYVGKGRLEEPEKIVEIIAEYFSQTKLFAGEKILVTAGATRERLDPVRYFTNDSSGKMGYAIAEIAAQLGADVTLISGITSLQHPANVTTIQVESATQMYEQVIKRFESQDIIIKAAAVADYRPKNISTQKIKKDSDDYVVEMEKTTDILKTLGQERTHQFLVGFAAETNDVEMYAKQKLESKNLHMVVANDVTKEGAGFGVDTNIVTIYKRDGASIVLSKQTKKEVAYTLLKEIVAFREEQE